MVEKNGEGKICLTVFFSRLEAWSVLFLFDADGRAEQFRQNRPGGGQAGLVEAGTAAEPEVVLQRFEIRPATVDCFPDFLQGDISTAADNTLRMPH